MAERDYSDLVISISHPHGEIEMPLDSWIEEGPGLRPLLKPYKVRRKSTGEALPLSAIPIRYRNTVWSRLLISLGVIRNPWSSPRKGGDE